MSVLAATAAAPALRPRRGRFSHPLSAAEFSAARASLARAGPFRLSYLTPLLASALATRHRRIWIRQTREDAAAIPSDWHLRTPPVFILGFWRSGTTLLHELMACDPAFAAPSLLDVLCPADAPYLLAEKRGLVAKVLPPDRGFDAVEMGHDRPQEEEWALAQLGATSFFNAFYFPALRERLIEESLFLERPQAREAWGAAHARFLRILSAKYPGRRLLLKNPANSTRLPALRALYPEARFVRIDRAPEEVIPSLSRMMDGLAADFSLQGPPSPFTEADAQRLHRRVTAKLDADWRVIPRELRFAVRYDRLTEFPMRTVERIYEALGLEQSETAKNRQRRFWLSRGRRRPTFASTAETPAASEM